MNSTRCKVQDKVKYSSHADAEDAMFLLYKIRNIRSFGSYRCPHCSCWHLTSMYDNRSNAALDRFNNRNRSKKKKRSVVKTSVKKKEKFVPVYLPREQYLEAVRQLNNKPAGRWLRIKDWLRNMLQ